MNPLIDETGSVFGRWTVLRLWGKPKPGVLWLCRCECGAEKPILGTKLRAGKSNSCGCVYDRHGDFKGGACSKEYKAWRNMRQRCLNPKCAGWMNYGGRGIRVSEEWNLFSAFLSDMGRMPTPKHTLERINNDGNYSKENCRWATRAEQSLNRRITKRLTIGGDTKPLVEWAHRFNQKPKNVYQRITVLGMSPIAALTAPRDMRRRGAK